MLTQFDHAVIEYAYLRGEESEDVYKRIDRLPNHKGYRENYTEQELLALLEVAKEKDDNTHLCHCGSWEYPEEVYDARGIYVTRVCDQCRAERLKGYRPEIFTDSAYECDEPIEPDEDTPW